MSNDRRDNLMGDDDYEDFEPVSPPPKKKPLTVAVTNMALRKPVLKRRPVTPEPPTPEPELVIEEPEPVALEEKAEEADPLDELLGVEEKAEASKDVPPPPWPSHLAHLQRPQPTPNRRPKIKLPMTHAIVSVEEKALRHDIVHAAREEIRHRPQKRREAILAKQAGDAEAKKAQQGIPAKHMPWLEYVAKFARENDMPRAVAQLKAIPSYGTAASQI